MSNRVTGPSPSEPQRNQPITQAQKDEAKKVGKVEKIDPDEQARNRRKERFRMMMEESDDVAMPNTQKPPSPFDLFSSGSPKKSLGNLEDSALPSPTSSPPPTVQQSSGSDDETEEDLPHSGEFWHRVNLPDEPPPSKPNMLSKGKEELEEAVPNVAGKKKKEIPLEPNQQPTEKATKGKPKTTSSKHPSPPSSSMHTPTTSKTKPTEKQGVPTGRYWDPEQRIERQHGSALPQEKEEEETRSAKLGKKTKQAPLSREKEEELEPKTEKRTPPSRPFEMASPPREKKRDVLKEKDDVLVVRGLPPMPAVPADVQAAAVQAAMQAQPYLSPEALPLFFQLVGSMMVMVARSGISTTEVRLTGSAFTNSKFYGSLIEITKFSTAPNSINIRLSGSNEAVTTFNQNLGQLRTAFEQGDFNFRVGRLVAEYATDRPVFRRKGGEGRGEKGAGGEGTGEKRK